MVVVVQNTAYDILIDPNAERQSDLLCNSWATPVRIAALHLDDGVDEFFRRPFRSPFASLFWRKQQPIFSKPAMMRSNVRKFGARIRERFKISS